jgi:solute carrier family 35 protein F5
MYWDTSSASNVNVNVIGMPMYQNLSSADNDGDDDDDNDDDQELPSAAIPPPPAAAAAPAAVPAGEEENDDNDDNQQYYWTEHDHRIAAAKIAPVWFVSNYAYNASLQYTSITSSTVLANTGSLFSFSFAVLMKDEQFSYWKLFGVFFGIAGCVITGLHDAAGGGSSSNHDTNTNTNNDKDNLLWGDVLSFISAVFYGCYAVMVRVLCPRDESLMSMQLFLGYVGLWNMIILSPVVIWQVGIAHTTSISAFVFGCLVVKGLFDNVLSDYLWARSVVLTSATVATVGLGLTIPLAFVSDVFMGRENVFNLQSLVGALAVLTGFLLVNVGQQQEEEVQQQHHHHHEGQEFHGTMGQRTRTTGGNESFQQECADDDPLAADTARHRHPLHHMSLESAGTGESEGFKDVVQVLS